MDQDTRLGGWMADPTGRYALRWWDGSGWTGHVSRHDGSTVVDPNPVAVGLGAPTAGPAAGTSVGPVGAAAWAERRPAAPLVPQRRRPLPMPGLVVLGLGLAGLALSVFALSWISFTAQEACETLAKRFDEPMTCDRVPDHTISYDRQDLADRLEELTEANGGEVPGGPSQASEAYLRWAGPLGLVVLLVGAAAAGGRLLPWRVVAGMAGVLLLWHGATIVDLRGKEDGEFLAVGAHLGLGALVLVVLGAAILHVDTSARSARVRART